MKDNAKELLPVVDAEGMVIGQTTRGEAHSGVNGKPLHPVVHLHLFNLQGELFLQHRPVWKDIQPDRWDTAVGGHVDWGEDLQTALIREVREEIGIEINVVNETKKTNETEGCENIPEFLTSYVFESPRERELVNVFRLVTTSEPQPSEELDGGRFFSRAEILEKIGHDFFTPNFEEEYQKIFG